MAEPRKLETDVSTGDTYIAGMWRDCLVLHLCWRRGTATERSDVDPLSRRPSQYRAPSWSWLSIDSHVELYSNDIDWNDSYKEVFDILNVEVENSSQGVFGSIRNGHILGCGMLRVARYEPLTSEDRSGVLVLGDQILEPGKGYYNFHTNFSLDVDVNASFNAWCLPLVERAAGREYNGDLYYIGIILVETGERKNEFKRIGHFELDYDSCNDFLLLRAGSQPFPRHSIFTII